MVQPAEIVTGRDVQREETRKRLREAAVQVFRRDGLATARIDDIVRRAGVSRGSFYFHFPTKEHVLLEVLAEAEAEIAAELAKLPRTAPLKKALDRFSAAFAKRWSSEPRLFPDVGAVAMRRAAAAIHGDSSNAVHHALIPFFRGALARGEVRSSPPSEVQLDLFLVSAFAGAMGWCARPEATLEAALAAVTDVFLRGVRVRTRR
jgi:AcrR family transcriptional regulator